MKQMKKRAFMVLIFVLALAILIPQVSWAATTSTANLVWIDKATIYEVNVRQYTKEGTFNAFAKHLTRLKKLGVDVLWFMPIHRISEKNRKGTLGSYYAVADYKSVNPEFGTKEDFKALVDQAHKMGFKVIMDWVANHTGMDNVWTENKSWYNLSPEGDLMPPTGTDWTDVAQLNYNNADMRAAMIDAMKYWVKDFGIDGYRCDVADRVPVEFWEEATAQLRTIKPVYMLAEANNNDRLFSKAFQSDYDWNLLGLFNEIGKGNADAFHVNQLLSHQETWYPAGTFPMNFITNHDENSWNGTEYERLGKAVKPLTALYFTLPGIPLIYTGQEAAFNRRLAFFEKDQVDWGNYSLQTYLQNLITLKKANRALWNGSAGGPYKTIQTTTDDVLAFERSKGSNRVVVVMNLTSNTTKVTISFGNIAGKYKAFSSNKAATLTKSQTIQLKPWAFEIYSK